MLRKLIFGAFVFFVSFAGLNCGRTENSESVSVEKPQQIDLKPFRVLVIIGDQWTDPQSYAIDGRRVKSEDFLDVINMLKAWGVPFDILRLDQQRLQINRFLDGEAKPNYGCIIWMADPAKLTGYSANFETLKRAVNEYGISMIGLFDYIKTDQVAGLIGINLQNEKNIQTAIISDKFVITGDHFITADAVNISLPDKKQLADTNLAGKVYKEDLLPGNLINCTVSGSAKVLARAGNTPQIVVNDINDDTKTVWIGGGRDWFRKYPVMRKIFRKALVYSMGYGLFNDDFENGFIFIMDDIGAADHSWLLQWHYPTPPEDTLIKYLIEPLEKHGFMMVQCITSGYLDLDKKMIVPPWTVKPFRDIYGNWQDYGSSKKGLDEGIKRGVFEIQHDRAWSHMNRDLESPPGPIWNGTIEGGKENYDWYNEVSDVTRGNIPVPANDLLFIYKSGIDAVKKAFGVTPIDAEIYPGSDLGEGTHAGDDNGRIAAIAGLGVGRDSYVGFDHTIEFKMMLPEQFTCHDLDLTVRTDNPADEMGEWSVAWSKLGALTKAQLLTARIAGVRSVNLHNEEWIESRKDKHWMGYNEMCAYLHAEIANQDDGLNIYYDNHYCAYFEKNPSSWTVELSDSFRKKAGGNARISIDGKTLDAALQPEQKVEIPAGAGIHNIKLFTNR
jgi:hypothetical protein